MLDYWDFMGKSYDPNTRHAISLNNLKACAQAQGVTFQYGDILIIRTGWIDSYNNMSQPERVRLTQVPLFAHDFVGVDQTEEMADFLHDNYFSAVASDTPAFEVWPQAKDVGWNHHSNLLPLWGVPIGELWDLERLSEVCRELKQYEFFFMSTPMNVDGKSPSLGRIRCMCLMILIDDRCRGKPSQRDGNVLTRRSNRIGSVEMIRLVDGIEILETQFTFAVASSGPCLRCPDHQRPSLIFLTSKAAERPVHGV